MSGENHELDRGPEEGEEGDLSIDAIAQDDLPEWATDGASVPDRSAGAEADDGGADAEDDAPSAAAAVNFANVETGASESVTVSDDRQVTAETVDSPDAVGFSAGPEVEDTAGTSIDPDLDDVDPDELLEADESSPSPGDDGPAAPTAGTSSTAGTGGSAGPAGPSTTEGAGTTSGVSTSGGGPSRSTPGSGGQTGRWRESSGERLGEEPSVIPDDPTLAFGLGMSVMLVAAAVYFLMAAVLGPVVAAVVVLGTTLVLGGAAYAADPFDRR